MSPALALDELSDVDESWFEEIQNSLKRRYLPDSPVAIPSPPAKAHSNPRVPSPSTSRRAEPSQYSSQELILPPWPALSSHADPTIKPEFSSPFQHLDWPTLYSHVSHSEVIEILDKDRRSPNRRTYLLVATIYREQRWVLKEYLQKNPRTKELIHVFHQRSKCGTHTSTH